MALTQVTYEVVPDVTDPSAFAITIDYDPLVESPGRIFRSAAYFADAFATLDGAFISAIDSNIETSIALLRVEQGSFRAWLATILRSVDDEALRDLDLKKIIGSYLVTAKWLALRWLEDESGQQRLGTLQEEIEQHARETEIRLIPAYQPPSRALLLDGLRRTQVAKEMLLDADRVTFLSDAGSVLVNPSARLDLTSLPDVEVESRQTHPLRRASLKVKKPDLLGHSQWQMKFKDRTVPSSMDDQGWLSRFQAREVTLRPGDALICDGEITTYYDRSGTPISEKAVITKVHGIEYQPSQLDLV